MFVVPRMIHSLFILLSYVCFGLCSFENTFKDYNLLLPDRYNPIFGALWIESEFLLKAYLYGSETKGFVACVRNLFQISDPNSTSSSDFRVKNGLKMGLGNILKYLNNSPNSKFYALLQGCSEDNVDSVLLWAAFYVSKQREILKKDLEHISKTLKLPNPTSAKTNFADEIIYLVKNHRGAAPVPQIQSNVSLPGFKSVKFFNCVESTTLDMINFGMFSNPKLKNGLSFESLQPHWSKDVEFREAFFGSIGKSRLKTATEEEVKTLYIQMFTDISNDNIAKENWARVNQDLPRISYANFYIVSSEVSCDRQDNSQFVKVSQAEFDSMDGVMKTIEHPKNECSEVKFKYLKDSNIYLTKDDGIILYEMDAVLRNFEGIIRYFFGLDFNNFKVDQSDKESFENLKESFETNLQFTISFSSFSPSESTFHVKFNNDSCSGKFTVTKQRHAFTSDFRCLPDEILVTNYKKLLYEKGLPSKMEQSIEYFNVDSEDKNIFDENEIKVFSNKAFEQIFSSSFIKMESVFHYAEKSQHKFKSFFESIIIKEPDVKKYLLNIFKNEFVMQMELNELNASLSVVAAAGDTDFLKLIIETIPNVDPSANANAALRDAASKGQLDVVQYLLSIKEKYPNVANGTIFALKFAALKGQLNVVKYIISINPNSVYINSAFRMAATGGHLNIVQYLMSFNENDTANVDPCGENNFAFKQSAAYGHLDVVEYLISIQARFPCIDPCVENNYALKRAASSGRLNVVQYLISIRDKFECIDPCAENNDALRSAATNGHLNVLKYLISIKSKFPNINPSVDNNYALKNAAGRKHLEVVQYLVEYFKKQNIFIKKTILAILKSALDPSVRSYLNSVLASYDQ